MKKPIARIIGANGNVFNLIGIVARALKDAGQKEQAEEFKQRVTDAKSYDEALQIMMDYIEPRSIYEEPEDDDDDEEEEEEEDYEREYESSECSRCRGGGCPQCEPQRHI